MNRPPPSPYDGLPHAFLVERYLTQAAAHELASSTDRLARICAGHGVRYLYSAYLPAEDTCFCLFQAPSADAVQAANEQARFAFDRLVDAVLMRDADAGMPPDQGDHHDRNR